MQHSQLRPILAGAFVTLAVALAAPSFAQEQEVEYMVFSSGTYVNYFNSQIVRRFHSVVSVFPPIEGYSGMKHLPESRMHELYICSLYVALTDLQTILPPSRLPLQQGNRDHRGCGLRRAWPADCRHEVFFQPSEAGLLDLRPLRRAPWWDGAHHRPAPTARPACRRGYGGQSPAPPRRLGTHCNLLPEG